VKLSEPPSDRLSSEGCDYQSQRHIRFNRYSLSRTPSPERRVGMASNPSMPRLRMGSSSSGVFRIRTCPLWHSPSTGRSTGDRSFSVPALVSGMPAMTEWRPTRSKWPPLKRKTRRGLSPGHGNESRRVGASLKHSMGRRRARVGRPGVGEVQVGVTT
jgi:hypothetical protein